MTKSVMQTTIDKLYRILSRLATENVLLHREIERLHGVDSGKASP